MEIKNSKEIIFLVVILSLLVVILGSYIVYDKILNDNNSLVQSFNHLKIDIKDCMNNSSQQYCKKSIDFNNSTIDIKIEKKVANITTRRGENYKYIGQKTLHINNKSYNFSDDIYGITGIIYLINDIVLIETIETNSKSISLIALNKNASFLKEINNFD